MAIVHKLEPVRYDYKQLRVAAYARVSSKSDDQKNSFASQVNYYRNLISTYPNYVFAGIYADEGITGTTIKGKRDDFERMLFDCRHHKIDRILVKSIQRFSRNTVDCISALRELKNCGVSVFFEKEGIDTDIVEGEVLITLLSYFSQCESTNIAKNCRWGFATRAAQGKYKQNKPPLGYDVKNGELVINDEEAKVVMRIFEMRLKDIGSQTIAKILTQEGIKNKAGKASWKQNTISYILQNERYIGDKLLQKRMTTDTLPFRLLKNANQKPQFYIKDTHEGIISKEDFDTVQMMIKKQKETFHNAEIKNKRHLFTSLVVCGECGTNYKYVKNRDIGMYVCQQKDYDKTTCQSCYVKEDTIKQGFVDVYNEGLANKEEILKLEKYAYQDNLNKEKQELTIQLNKAIREKLNLDKELLITSNKDLEEKHREVLTTIEHLKQSLKEKDTYVHKMVGANETEKLQNVFLEYSDPIEKFDAGLFHKTIHRIRIENEEMVFIWINKKETRITIHERRAKKSHE